MQRLAIIAALSFLVSACGNTAAPVQSASVVTAPKLVTGKGLDAVIGHTREMIIATFGEPRLDFMEGPARKLQFSGAACVLDVYLYPQGSGAPLATHVDARRSDGAAVDRAACVNALRQR